jgi:hypothetical protein
VRAAWGRFSSVAVMSYRLSRLMSTATAGYGAFALAKPEHLGNVLQADKEDRPGYDLLAQAYGVRDLAIGAFGLFGRSGKTVRTAMLIRILMDLGDAALLAPRMRDDAIRQKVLAVTLGWAGLNAVALAIDSVRND